MTFDDACAPSSGSNPGVSAKPGLWTGLDWTGLWTGLDWTDIWTQIWTVVQS